MYLKQTLIYFIVVAVVSCTNNSKNGKHEPFKASQTGTRLIRNGVTSVDIFYSPSFSNRSILHLDRLRNEGSFIVDTLILWSYGRPDTLPFSITDLEKETDIERFWSPTFIKSLRQDSTMLGWTDGMPVWVYFVNNGIRDSVYLGNVHPRSVDSVLSRQLEYVRTHSKNKAMKGYIEDVKRYINLKRLT
jgi:hypothetical protein